MKKYEGMFIIKPDLEKDSKKKTVDFISGAITKEGGEIKDTSEWGKNRLAYKINRYNEGLYILTHFNLPPEKLGKVEKSYNLNEDILKSMIIVDETKPEVKADGEPK
jgi:small subunit ribosomal protein S6